MYERVYDWWVRRRMYLVMIQRCLESMNSCLPSKKAQSYVNTCIKKYEKWCRTFNLRVTYNLGKNKEYAVLEIPNFLTNEHCDDIINLAKQKGVQDSTVVDDRGMNILDLYIRKSKQTWLGDTDERVEMISRIVADITNVDKAHQEDLQVVAYNPSCYYNAHYDASFHPKIVSQFHRGCGPRLYTVLVYLNDDFEGGETDFPEVGIRIKPKKGTAIIFQNIDENFDVIPESMHAGCPVSNGTKWIANKWIRVWPMELMHATTAPPQSILSLPKHMLRTVQTGMKDALSLLQSPICRVYEKTVMKLNKLWHAMICKNQLFPYVVPRDGVIEIDNAISDNLCAALVNGDTDARQLIDQVLTNTISNVIRPPYGIKETFDKLAIVERRGHQGDDIVSPYAQYEPVKNCSRFGLTLMSVYVLLNDDYKGGEFEFPFHNKTIKPCKGKAVLIIHTDNCLSYDPASLLFMHKVEGGVQKIAVKTVSTMPLHFMTMLQSPSEMAAEIESKLKGSSVIIHKPLTNDKLPSKME